jgi:hypothetical protein
MESSATAKENVTFSIPNWSERISKESDPNNREIIAYLSGKEDGKIEESERTKTLFFTNLEVCCYYSTKFFNYITQDKKIVCDFATIKAESINSFHSLFLIPFEQYKDKDVRSALFKEANDFRKALKIKDVLLEISVMPVTEKIDKSEIYSDGFILDYNINDEAPANVRPRKAQ